MSDSVTFNLWQGVDLLSLAQARVSCIPYQLPTHLRVLDVLCVLDVLDVLDVRQQVLMQFRSTVQCRNLRNLYVSPSSSGRR